MQHFVSGEGNYWSFIGQLLVFEFMTKWVLGFNHSYNFNLTIPDIDCLNNINFYLEIFDLLSFIRVIN